MKFVSILLILTCILGFIQTITHVNNDAKRLAKHTHAIMAAARDAHRHHRNPRNAAIKAAHQIKKEGDKRKNKRHHGHHHGHHGHKHSGHSSNQEHSPRAAVEAATKYAKRHGKDVKKAGENAIKAIRKRSQKLKDQHGHE